MAWTVDDSGFVAGDLDSVFDHLLDSHLEFGEPFKDAFELATRRVNAIYEDRRRILKAPHIGTSHRVRGRDYRHVTIDRAIYWFALDDAAQVVRKLGIFHGGQDHLGRMMARLTKEGGA